MQCSGSNDSTNSYSSAENANGPKFLLWKTGQEQYTGCPTIPHIGQGYTVAIQTAASITAPVDIEIQPKQQ